MLSYIFGKRASAEEQAEAELMAGFHALTAQKELVAKKRQAYDSLRSVTDQAEKNMKASKSLFETAVSTIGEKSKEADDLNINYRAREAKYNLQWQQLFGARKELDAAVLDMTQKQEKYNQLQGVKILELPSVEKKTTQPGKVVIPQAVLNHFEGNNREHVNTAQQEAVREELAQTRSGIDFAKMHQKLSKTLFHSASRDQEQHAGPSAKPVSLLLCAALEEKFKAMKKAEEQDISKDIKNAIHARRRLFED